MEGLELTIFLSGTMKDLCEERTAIRTQIGPPLYQVVAAEDWGSQRRSSRDLCIRSAEGSDVYLGLYGGRYGYILRSEGISVTEWEFNTAREAGKPALIYIRRGRKGPKQRPFLERISDFHFGHNRRPEFENCDQLVAWVREDLIHLMEDLVGETEGDVTVTRDSLIYVKCRLNLALLARESKQWEQAMRHCQWVLSRSAWNEIAHDLALRELQSLYKERESWDEVIEMACARVELARDLASSEWRLPTGHVETHMANGFPNSRLLELADLYVEWARADVEAGRWQGAVDHLEDALEIYRDLGKSSSEESTLGLLAETYEVWAISCEGMPRRAERAETARAYRNAIKVYEGMRDRDKLATLWSRLAQVYMREGKNIGALQSLRKSLEYQEENGTPRVAVDEIVGNLQNLFEIQCRRRWYLAAVKTLLRQVEVLLWAGRHQQAIRTTENAVELCLEIDSPRLLLDARAALGSAYEAAGTLEDLQNARTAYQQALDLAIRLGVRGRIAALRESAGRVSEEITAPRDGDEVNTGGGHVPTT